MNDQGRYIRLDDDVEFESSHLETVCKRIWEEFYRRISLSDSRWDHAIWVTHLTSASLWVRPGSPGEECDDVDWEPQFVLSISVNDLGDRINELLQFEDYEKRMEALQEAFDSWAYEAIARSWKSKDTQVLHSRSGTGKISVYAALDEDEFEVSNMHRLCGVK